MRPMSTEDFLREIVFRNNGNSSSSGTLLSGTSGPMPPQAAGWQSSAPRQSLLGSPQAGATGTGSSGFGTSLFRMRCTTNQHGKIEAKEEQTPTESTRWEYTYDVAGHLATVRCNGAVTEKYTYNAQGQRIADSVPEALRHRGGQRRFSYNYEGQLVEVNSTRYLYTASGTLRGKQEGSKNTYFSYGDDTRLDNITVPSGFEVRYEYGQSLLPERIHVSGRLVGEYRWHGQLQLHEYYDVMQDTRYTFQYKGQRLPTGVHISGTGAAFIKERFQRGNLDQYSPMFQTQGATDSLFLHIGADQVGSVRTLSTEDGPMVKEITYDSFGNVLRDSFPQLSFPLGFAGGLVDEHTGFVRFGYRDYDPQTGRFTAQDPARDLRGDADLYNYCVDDPVSCNDPQGLATRQWNESLHPRDDVGKFTFKDGADNLPRDMREYKPKKAPLGVNYNNPLNVVSNKNNPWNGQIGIGVGKFTIFQDVESGLRAGAITVLQHQVKNNCQSIQEIINKHANTSPADERARYAQFIASGLNKKPTDKITLTDSANLTKVLRLMMTYEIGKKGANNYSENQLSNAVNQAIEHVTPQKP